MASWAVFRRHTILDEDKVLSSVPSVGAQLVEANLSTVDAMVFEDEDVSLGSVTISVGEVNHSMVLPQDGSFHFLWTTSYRSIFPSYRSV